MFIKCLQTDDGGEEHADRGGEEHTHTGSITVVGGKGVCEEDSC